MLKVDPPLFRKVETTSEKKLFCKLRKGTGVTKCIHSGELASLRFS